jgi:hypothetical protein
MGALIVTVLVLVAAPCFGGDLSDFLGVRPISWALLDSADLNGRIEQAALAGESWPDSPLSVTLSLFGDDRETQSLVIEEVKNAAEGAKSTTVVYIRDGFLDDAVLGDWHEVDYRCLPDGTWRVVEARHAWRCRRPDQSEFFGDYNCH